LEETQSPVAKPEIGKGVYDKGLEKKIMPSEPQSQHNKIGKKIFSSDGGERNIQLSVLCPTSSRNTTAEGSGRSRKEKETGRQKKKRLGSSFTEGQQRRRNIAEATTHGKSCRIPPQIRGEEKKGKHYNEREEENEKGRGGVVDDEGGKPERIQYGNLRPGRREPSKKKGKRYYLFSEIRAYFILSRIKGKKFMAKKSARIVKGGEEENCPHYWRGGNPAAARFQKRKQFRLAPREQEGWQEGG